VSEDLSPVAQWILDTMALGHLRDITQGRYGDVVWSYSNLIDLIPPNYATQISSGKDIEQILLNFLEMGYVKQHGEYFAEFKCIIKADGILAFKRSLNPLILQVKNKKNYNKIIEKTLGNPTIKNELKKLGDDLRDRTESEIVNGLLSYLIKRGPEAVLYLLELLNNSG
jgi:hypothetical protein